MTPGRFDVQSSRLWFEEVHCSSWEMLVVKHELFTFTYPTLSYMDMPFPLLLWNSQSCTVVLLELKKKMDEKACMKLNFGMVLISDVVGCCLHSC